MEKRDALIERLISAGYLKTPKVIEAMRSVSRELFVPKDVERLGYEDMPLPIGEEQTISAPHMVAIMCESADLMENQSVLEIGAGSGYHACVMSRITKKKVYTVERLEGLAETARENLERAGCGEVCIFVGDGTLGHTEKAPYDRIVVTAASPDVPPPLFEQLKVGGKLLIPVGSRLSQDLLRITRTEKGREEENLGGCVFVPLIGKYGWKE